MPRRIESVFVQGPAGRLEALLEEPEDQEPREAALVCHPHPQHGGTMHNKVVHRTARALRRAGCVVLRFNYRGVNLSDGTYDRGIGETEDAKAALAFLRARYPALPFTIAGFSFGSRIALKIGCTLPETRYVLAVGFPTSYQDRGYLAGCTKRKVFVQSTQDEHGPLNELEPLVAGLDGFKELITVPAEDHFFKGALDAFEQTVFDVQMAAYEKA
jgi:uncharacterized protein